MTNGLQENDHRNAPPATVVIFGASGDLTRRKLIPAVQSLARHGRLTDQFAIVGVARTPMDDQQFVSAVLDGRGRPAARRSIPVHLRRLRRLGDLQAAQGAARRPRHAAGHGRQPAVLPVHPAAGVPARGQRAGRGRAQRRARRLVRPPGHREALRARRAERQGARRDRARRVRRDPGLPHRPLSGQGHRPERARAALRQRHLPADLGPRRGSTTCRSRWPRRSASAPAAASTSTPARCATSCRTTCCRCSRSR